MNSTDFRRYGKEMIDYVADYMETVNGRRVTPDVEPGFLRDLIPPEPPKNPEKFTEIMDDVDTKFMPGITNWQHRNFHAFFPTANSYPSILGELLSSGTGCAAFSWAASPAGTELEIIMLDWVGKMLNLPTCFLHENNTGGGVMQNSATDCILACFLTARYTALSRMKRMSEWENADDAIMASKLVAYTSELAHSSVLKCAAISLVKIRKLEVDENFSLRGPTLEEAIKEDRAQGLIPFFVCATVGTTSCCSFDNVSEIADVCDDEEIWLHVDAAYAGNALICPEFRYLIRGIEGVDSLNMNAHKGMLLNFECSLMWVRDCHKLTSGFTMNPLYLQHNHTNDAINFMNWGIPLTRRIRALKLWFVIRTYGVEGLQKNQRERVRLAKMFEESVRGDNRFEVVGQVTLGLVCFRLKGPNVASKKLLHRINESGKLYMVPAIMGEIYVIRFTIITENANDSDVLYAWKVISKIADKLPPAVSVHRDGFMNSLEDIEEPGLITYMFPMMKTHRRLSIPCGNGESSDDEKDNKVEIMADRRRMRGRRLSTPQIYIPCSNTREYAD
ncbi:hypothetical protein ScPMuIL_008934 [Solemya velum]